MGRNKFFKGIVFGAMAGGLLSLLDRTTRQEVGSTLKNSGQYISTYSKNPKQLVDSSREMYEKLKVTADQVSKDIQFITEKVDEIKGMTPQVKEIIEETKETFEDSSEAYKDTFTEKETANELTGENEESQPVTSSFKGY